MIYYNKNTPMRTEDNTHTDSYTLSDIDTVAESIVTSLDFLGKDFDTTMSVLAYAVVKIVMAEAQYTGEDPGDEVTRFASMLKSASNTVSMGAMFSLN